MGQRRNHMEISILYNRNVTYQKDVIQTKLYLLENRKTKKISNLSIQPNNLEIEQRINQK